MAKFGARITYCTWIHTRWKWSLICHLTSYDDTISTILTWRTRLKYSILGHTGCFPCVYQYKFKGTSLRSGGVWTERLFIGRTTNTEICRKISKLTEYMISVKASRYLRQAELSSHFNIIVIQRTIIQSHGLQTI